MNNQIKYEYIKRLWYLQDGVIFTRWGISPLRFPVRIKTGGAIQSSMLTADST